MYALRDYGWMISDSARLARHRRALAASITPGSVVLDLGAGTGIMALSACQLGAKRVYAVDTSDAISVAMATAKANGWGDRIICLQGDCRHLPIPERVDVVVADLRGLLPLFPGNLETMAHVKRHWLRAGGALIPQRDLIRAALVRSPRMYRKATMPWRSGLAGLDLSPALRWSVNQWLRGRLRATDMLVKPQTWGTVEYGNALERESRELSWKAQRAATAHGFALWFDSELTGRIGFSNAPGKASQLYGQAFFPFEAPLVLKPGDQVSLDLSVQLAHEYLWTWNVRVEDQRGRLKRELRQSNFLGQLIGPGRLQRSGSGYRGALGESGLATLATLEAIRSGETVGEAAKLLFERHATLFEGSPERSMAFAADMYDRYSSGR